MLSATLTLTGCTMILRLAGKAKGSTKRDLHLQRHLVLKRQNHSEEWVDSAVERGQHEKGIQNRIA